MTFDRSFTTTSVPQKSRTLPVFVSVPSISVSFWTKLVTRPFNVPESSGVSEASEGTFQVCMNHPSFGICPKSHYQGSPWISESEDRRGSIPSRIEDTRSQMSRNFTFISIQQPSQFVFVVSQTIRYLQTM